MANTNFRLTLKNKILILLLCVVITSNTVIGVISQKNSLKSMTTAVYQQLSYMSGGLAGQVAEMCTRQFSVLHILALLDIMRDPDVSLQEKQEHLSSIINSYEGNYENLAFYDINGNAITADGRILNFATREYFTTAISGKDFMSQPAFSTVTNSVLQHVSVPVYDFDGNILGAIVLVINGNIYLDLIQDIDLGFGMHPSIISRKTMTTVANCNEGVDENANPEELDTTVGLGLILNKLFQGESGTQDFLDPSIGIHMVTSYQPISGTDWSVFAVAPYDFYFGSLKRMKLTMAILILVTIILSIIVCTIFVKILVNPLKAVKDSIQEIASGNADLTQRLPIFNNDEIGDVVIGFNKFVEKLQNIVRNLLISKDGLANIGNELQDKTHDTSASITEIIANIESVNNMITTQSNSVTETAGAVNEISSNIESLERMIENQATGVTQASSTIEQMIGNINSVNSAVEKMVESFNNLEQNATYGMTTQNSANEQITKIEEQSTLLQDANTAIANIAEQTNLLAMNAAIEAAHAGEAGKGFSVVADEIRKLSETSSEQSNTIGLELTKIQQTIKKIVEVTKITNSVFMTVTKNINETSQIIEQIRGAMNEQQVGSHQIIEALHTMNDSTSEVRIASSEMALGNKQILDEIKRLQDSTDVITQSVKEMHIGARQINNTGAALTHISSQVTDNISNIVKEVGMFRV